MTHPNAALTPRHRLKVARLVVDDGSPISEVAARFEVSWPTVKSHSRVAHAEIHNDETAKLPQRCSFALSSVQPAGHHRRARSV